MTEGGVITGERLGSIVIFIPVGGMITGVIGGEDNRGIISGYLTMSLIAIGVTGKETDTGAVADLLCTMAVDLVRPVADLLCAVAVDLVRPVEDLLCAVAVDLVRPV
jgi:hypothetical protein